MTDLFDLEAEMYAAHADTSRAEAARSRVDAFNALPYEEQRNRLLRRPDPGQMAAARRALRMLGQPGTAMRLHRMENEVIALLHPDDQERFRASQ